ncbi:MAG: BMP family ABC transporter substrate-binding protein [Erysipelotrichaceae bacterium]|jgi:basic membrane lipoprotein Med (substrate-binding protein (PBP1-ABC) superfamily)|nr:BMP family ABC transporter substrate-binding protein [Erysipelotrichaceae bacterium]
MNEEYVKARKLGEKAIRRARNEGRDPYLPVLDEILPEADSLLREHVGVQEIPLRMIVGTKNKSRANAFSCSFMPIMAEHTELSEKWAHLYDAQIEEGIRDPIQVYEYMLHFYVQEGNKRVSVLKYLDVPSIEADITRILPKRSEDPEYLMYQEFLEFYACAPIYDIVFTQHGSYHRFASMVNHDLTKKWDLDFINIIRGSFFRFYSVFEKKGGDKLPITAGDAFLLYLQVYRFDSLLDRSRDDIEERLDAVWKEVLLETKAVKVSLIKEPMKEDKKNFFSLGSLYNENHPLQVLFIYGRDPETDSWEQAHERGRLDIEKKYAGIVHTEKKIAAAGSDNPMRIGDEVKNYDAVFTTRRELMTDTLRAALKYPQVRFFNCSIYLNHQSVIGYFGRMYEVMFLLGRIAAKLSDNHKIGYVANAPVYGRLSEINAFAIGASLVDPQAQIYLAWSGKKDGHWSQYFAEENVHIYAGPHWQDEKDARPVHGIHQITEQGETVLAAPLWHWDCYYEKIIQMILERQWDQARYASNGKALNCWWGMDAGVIDLTMDPSLNWMIRKDADIYKRLLIQNAWNPFEGELHSQTEKIQDAGTERLASKDIIAMDWLNHNVIGSIPFAGELKDDMKRMTIMSGIKGTQER